MISFDCPKCHQIVTGPETLAGKTAKCAKCGQRLQIPPLPGRSAPPVPPSPRSWGIGSLLVPALGGAALATLATLPMVFFPNLNPLNQQADNSKPPPQVAEKKSAAKPNTKAESSPKTVPAAEPKAEPKPDRKPKAEPKSEPKAQPKTEPRPEPKPEPKAEPKPQPKEAADPVPAAILKLLASDKATDRLQGANDLAKLGEKGKTLTASLIQSMLQSWPTNKEAFLDALEKINPKLHKPVLTLLIDQNYQMRLQALGEIEALGPEGRAATPLLLVAYNKGLQSGDFRIVTVGQKAFLVMAKLDPQNKFVIQSVLAAIPANQLLFDQVTRTRTTPIVIALQMKIEPKLLVPVLIQALSKPGARGEAIFALSSIGPEAKAAVPHLNKLRFDSDSATREAATAALKNIQGK